MIGLMIDCLTDQFSTDVLRRIALGFFGRLDLVACPTISRLAIAHVAAEPHGCGDHTPIGIALVGEPVRAIFMPEAGATAADKADMVKLLQMLSQVNPRLFVDRTVPLPGWHEPLYPAGVVDEMMWSAVIFKMRSSLARLR